jgi:hypothetical protein
MTMHLEVHAYALARTAGERSEDAWAVDVDAGRLAVADGASSAWRAGDWASALVDAWIAKPPSVSRGAGSDGVLRWVDRARAGFDAEDLDGRGAPQGERAWFTEAAAARGSHAALLGLSVLGLGGRRPRVRAVAVGDVCLLQVRGDALVAATPLADASAFGQHPDLLSSTPEAPVPAVVQASGPFPPGDVLLLMTDALAAFALRTAVRAPAIWQVLAGIDTPTFAALCADAMGAGLLDRDDVTLLRIARPAGGAS